MIQTIVAALMWLLVASLLILRRRRAERSITYAALTIAVAMTLNVDQVYIAVDSVLGATNVATLLADIALMTGIFFLGRGIMKAGEYRPGLVRAALSLPMLFTAVAGIVTAFLLIRNRQITTTFMIDLGTQPAAAAYSIIEFTYCATVLIVMAVLAVRQYRLSAGAQRIPEALLLVGSLLGVALCSVIFFMDVAHVVGDLDAMDAAAQAYRPLYLLTFVFLCAGAAGQPTIRYARDRIRNMRTRVLARQLEPIWRQATLARPGLSQTGTASLSWEDLETRLHRQVVEIRDAMIDPRVTFQTSRHERMLLERAEKHLLGSDSPPADAHAYLARSGSQRAHS